MLTIYLCVFFGEMSIQVLCPSFIDYLPFYYGIIGVLDIFWVEAPYQIRDVQIFSHSVE